MGEPGQPVYDLDRSAYPPQFNPNVIVDGRDTLRPHTVEDYVRYAVNSCTEMVQMMHGEMSERDELAGDTRLTQRDSFFMNRNPSQLEGHVEDEIPGEVPGLRESEQYRTVMLPGGIGAVGDFAVAWNAYEQTGGEIFKVRPEITLPPPFTIQGDEDSLSVDELMRQHAGYQARVVRAKAEQDDAPEYTWESEYPDRITVTTHNGAHMRDLAEMSAEEVVNAARFLRTTARLLALVREDVEALANLIPPEPEPVDFRSENTT